MAKYRPDNLKKVFPTACMFLIIMKQQSILSDFSCRYTSVLLLLCIGNSTQPKMSANYVSAKET